MKQLLITTLATTLLLAGSALAQRPDAPATERPAEVQKAFVFEGDPYLLPLDPTGVELPALEKQLIAARGGGERRSAGGGRRGASRAPPERSLPRVDREWVAPHRRMTPLMTCPISGEKLGGDRGEPIEIVYKNRLVRLCCKMCVKKFRANPDKVVQQLNTAVIEQQAKSYPLATCPASGEDLGEGEIVDRVVSGRLIRLCCKMCTKKVAADPVRFVRAIDAAHAKQKRKGAGEEAEGRTGEPKARRDGAGNKEGGGK